MSSMPSAPSIAEEFFKQITTALDPVAFLKAIASSQPPTFEEEWLEFKGSGRTQPMDNSVKENWSKTLSAFANTQGGVLIWGIDAREDSTTKVDAACGLSLAANASALKSRLQTLLTTATDPPVPGVQIEVFETSPPEGFVVCYVPATPYRPHQAQHAGRRFYHRSGGSCHEANVTWLRRMFAPNIQPNIVPFVEIM